MIDKLKEGDDEEDMFDYWYIHRMLIAREKKKTNIAEYILYMWQVEDMLRALGLDMQRVNEHVVARFRADDALRKEIYDWYDYLVAMM